LTCGQERPVPTHVFTVVAADHSVDAQRNTVSLFSILEEVSVSTTPGGYQQFVVATLWTRDEGDEGVTFLQRVLLVSPSGKEVAKGEIPFTLAKARHRNFVSVVNPTFAETGTYRLEVSVRKEDQQGWTKVTDYPIDVRIPQTGPQEDLFGVDQQPGASPG
jgi:hypothetical protein